MQLGEQRLGDVSLAGSLEIIQPLFALGLAWRGMGRVVTTEAQCIAMNGDIDVFGETLDQLPGLGQRGAALEGEMLTRRQSEQFGQCPADPEILLNSNLGQVQC